MSSASGTVKPPPHYSVVIESSDEDQIYRVSIPESPRNYTHSCAYEVAVSHGHGLLDLLIIWTQRGSKPQPQPRVFAGAGASG